MKINPSIYKLSFLFSLLILLNSCYPDGPESNSDYDLLGTLYDEEFDFNQSSIFILPDTIVRVETPNDDKSFNLSNKNSAAILNMVRGSFVSNGWIDSTFSANDSLIPDVYITISYIATTEVGSYWSYWGWYGSWGGYYSGYPGGYPVYYQYSTGAMVLDMIDAKTLSQMAAGDTIPFVWSGFMNGLLTGTTPNIQRINTAVNKLFELSPYLIKE